MSDQDAAHLEYTQLKARLRELEAAVRALIAGRRDDHDTPCFSDERGRVYCYWCAGAGDGDESDHTPIRHDAECPWLRAKALLPEAP